MASVLDNMFVYPLSGYQLLDYALYFYNQKFNGIIIVGSILVLALKLVYVKNVLKTLKASY